MDLQFYKVIHLLGLMMVFTYAGAVAVQAGAVQDSWRKTLAVLHGLGLFLLLLGGFGMMARLEVTGFPWPGWVFVKLGIWLVVGASGTLMRKVPEKARLWMFLIMVLGTLAAYMALYKPF